MYRLHYTAYMCTEMLQLHVFGQKVKISELPSGDSPMGLSVLVSSKTITSPQLQLFSSLAAFHLTATPLSSLLVNCSPSSIEREVGGMGSRGIQRDE